MKKFFTKVILRTSQFGTFIAGGSVSEAGTHLHVRDVHPDESTAYPLLHGPGHPEKEQAETKV